MERTGKRPGVLPRFYRKYIGVLVRNGIRFSIKDGEIFINWRDLEKYDKLCREGLLPPSWC